jgi:hypothetical protein
MVYLRPAVLPRFVQDIRARCCAETREPRLLSGLFQGQFPPRSSDQTQRKTRALRAVGTARFLSRALPLPLPLPPTACSPVTAGRLMPLTVPLHQKLDRDHLKTEARIGQIISQKSAFVRR